MKHIFKTIFTLVVATFITGSASAQVTTNSGSGLAPAYPSLATAITALNGASITSPVIITLTGNETAPVGGYSITATGTAANTITIEGSASIITAATGLTVGTRNDAVFKLIGSDYITIQNFTMVENPANTVGGAIGVQQMTEFGVGIFAASTTNGAQNNTIQNNVITLSSTTAYQNAIGIFSTSASSSTNGAQAASSIAGTNSNNKIYGNTISGAATGIYFISPAQTATVFESGNDIGGTSLATGNNITFGISNTAGDLGFTSYSGTTCAGIYFRNVVGNSARYNTINTNVALTLPSGGVYSAFGTAPTGVTYTSNFSNNNITLTNVGITASTGVEFGSGLSTGTIVASNNTITINQTTSATNTVAIIGINASYASATSTLTTNTITINQNTSAGAINGASSGILANGVGTTVNVNTNIITIKQNAPTGTGSYGSGAITFINVGASSGTVNVNSNQLLTTGSTIRSTGNCFGINHTAGTITVGLNINSNIINIDRVAASGVINATNESTTPSTVAYTFTNNNVLLTGLAGTTSAGGLITLGGASATTPKTINNNKINISGTNTGTVTGIATGYSTGNMIGNKITINTASATINGLDLSSTGAGAYAINADTLSLISSSTTPTAMVGIKTGDTGPFQIYNNVFSALNFTGIITTSPTVSVISLAAGTGNSVYNNAITNVSVGATASSGSPIIDGILISGGTSTNVYKNKIYGITSNATGTATQINGIRISAGTTNNIYNNLIGDLTAPAGNGAADIIRGVNITSSTASSTINVYYNTINLNASSSGATFGTSCLFHTTSATATTAALDMRNNIFVNNSTPNGTGTAAAYRRSSTTLTNFKNTSNRNNFAAPIIFSDGTNNDATLAAYQARVAGIPADVNSISVLPTYLSTIGSSANFLHIDPSVTTAIESGAANIASYTDDFDGEARQGNPGYAGTGSAPDIGADEFETPTPLCSSASGGTIPSTGVKCDGQTISISSIGATTGTGISYQWKVATVPGGPYADVTGGTGATTTSFTSAALAAGTFYYVLETTCSAGPIVSLSNEDTVTVNVIPVTAVNPSSGTYCTPGGSAVSLTASGATTYSWSPSAGLNVTTGAVVSAAPSANTTYTVTGTTSGCSSTANVAVTVSEQPNISSVSATPASICSGANSSLTAMAGTTSAYTVQSATFANETPAGSATTIFITGADDAMSASIALPFSFLFYGQSYTNLFACTNGFIQLGASSGNTTVYGATFPTATAPNNIIAGVWDDLIYTSATATARYFTNGVAPNRVFIIEYTNVQFYNTNAQNGSVNFQIKLFETSNKIEIHTLSVNDPIPSNHFEGIENATGTVGSAPAGRAPYTTNITIPEAWAFLPSGGAVTYTWSPATFLSGTSGASVTANAMTASTDYTVTATAGGCSVTSSPLSVNVIDISAPVSAINVTCNGAADGSFALGTVGCGTAPFTYSLDGGATFGAIPTNLTAGPYSVIVKDDNGLLAPAQNITITEPAAVPVPVSSGNKTVCENASSVYVKVNSMQTVVIPFNIPSQPAETNAAPGNIIASANLPANLGTVTSAVLTYNGITAIGASWQSDVRLGLSGAVVDPAAAGTGTPNTNGSFNYIRAIPNNAVSLSGGTVNLLYWDSTNDLVGADATFTTGASAATLTITYNPAPTITWFDAPTAGTQVGAGDSIQAVGTTVLPNTTTPNTYNFYAQANFGGCPSPTRTLVTVTVNALPTVSYTATPNDTVCVGTQITLAGTGAASYTWSNGITNNTASTLTTQTYVVTGTGANGCVNTANAPVKVNALPTVTASVSPNDTVCSGTQVTLTGGGAVSYTWDNSVTDNSAFTPSSATYTVTGTDVNGCMNTASISLTVSTGLTASSSATTILCNGDNSTVTVSATGGVAPYTGEGTFTVTAGTYSYTVTDAAGCTSVTNITVAEPDVLSASSSETTAILCNGGTGVVTVVATGGTTPYSGDGAQTVSEGAYSFTVTDNNGCTASTSGTVNEPTPLSLSYTTTPVLCNGGTSTVTLSATGGTSPYSGTGSLSGVPAGTYVDNIVTDANGCQDTIDVTVTEPTPIVVATTTSPILCYGGTSTVVVTATGGTSPYVGEGTFTDTAANHVYIVTDANSCTGTASITISEPTEFTPSASSTTILCNGGTSTITITGTGGTAPYSGEVVETQTAGTYSYSLTDNNGCPASTDVTVSEPDVLSASSSVTTPIVCNGGSGVVTVVASGGTSPYSGDGAQSVNAGAYNIMVMDVNGCMTSATGNVTEPATALVASATTTAILCNGGTSAVVVSASGGVAPYTGEGSFTSNAGTYSYTVVDDLGCATDATGTISEPDVLSVDIVSSTIMCNGDSSTIAVTGLGGTAPYSGEVTEMLASGTYTYTITDDNACSVSQSVTISEPAENVVDQTATICPGGMVMVGSSTYTSAGTFADTLTSAAGCDSIINTTVIVNAAVVTTVTVNNETITADEAGATYQWVDCDNAYAPISGETNQTFTATANGNYAVIVSANGCSSDTSVCTLILTVGVKTVSQNLFNVYPNPNNGAFTISTNVAGVYNIVNELGQVVESLKLSNSNIYNVNLNVANGVYYVVGYNSNNDLVKQKIVVLK